MLTWFEGIFLGLVQGLAEFLPISSSGHLAALQYIFGIEGESVLLFAVLLHVGTLFSLLAVYYKDLWELLKELCFTIKDLCTGKGLRINCNETRRLGFMIIAATIPTAIIGLLFNDFFSSAYNSMYVVAGGLVFTGVLLMVADRMGRKGRRKDVRTMKFRNAVLVGIFQGIAILPGVSRSGSTLFGGLFGGLNRELAVRFAFLISVPSILGAVILEAPEAFEAGMDLSLLGPVMAGMAVAAVSGFVAIKTMIKVVSRGKLSYFSYYVWAAALALIIYMAAA
ncbi:MAG: undecaprenyl-diphosphate phosphatase [Bacillota bacterium]|nr:undecaprenyl-diphosphate phosphatase [Bacillota bacterium]